MPIDSPAPKPRPIQVDGRLHGAVVGCRRDDGRWLLIRRSRHVSAPRQLCFPGGGIELGEAREAAAHRELREEIGAEVRLIRQVWNFRHPERMLHLHGFLAELVTDPQSLTPDPMEVEEVVWLTSQEIVERPDVLAHTDRFLAKLLRALGDEG